MKHVLALYRSLYRPWMCVCVYLWALELQSVLRFDREPILDWAADCAAILLTLVFWALILCLFLLGLNVFLRHTTLVRFNAVVCNGLLIVITAYHFVRWLQIAVPTHVDRDVITGSLIVVVTILSLQVVRRLKSKPRLKSDSLPSLIDCYYFGALPILLAAVALVGVKTAGSLSLKSAETSLDVKLDGSTISEKAARPNVILIVSDGLRAQSMSLYGYDRNTTPFLQRFAKSSNIYLSMHSNSTSTKTSVTTIVSGKHPFSHGMLTKHQIPYRTEENLITVLKQNGYFTASIVSNEDASLQLLGFADSLSLPEFSEFNWLTLSWVRRVGIHPTSTGSKMYKLLSLFVRHLGFPRKTSYYGFADDTLEQAKRVLPLLREPYFLFVHLHEPHDPYEANGFRGIFSSKEAGKQNLGLPLTLYARYAPESQPAADAYRDQYEESIRFLDSELEKFMSFLEQSGMGENVLIIFTSDHGESFERGYMNHGEDLYESSTHVPLVIKFPGQTKGRRIEGLVDATDIGPTILRAANFRTPTWMDGRSFAEDSQPGAEAMVSLNYKHPIGQTIYPLPTKLAIWREGYKMIVSCDASKVELYHLVTDPGETVDLSLEEMGVVKELKDRLRSRMEKQPGGKINFCLKPVS